MSPAVQWDGPGIDAWQPWTPDEVATILDGCDAPWCIVGGWAIDLFLDHQSRVHADIEIAVPRVFFSDVRNRLHGYALYAVGGGGCRRLRDESFPSDRHQCWVLDPSVRKWQLDVMLEPGDRDHWVYRRQPQIRGLRSEFVLWNKAGIPFLAPQAVLLFKAAGRAKDNADFETVLPHLSPAARAWLRTALAAHPSSHWFAKLG